MSLIGLETEEQKRPTKYHEELNRSSFVWHLPESERRRKRKKIPRIIIHPVAPCLFLFPSQKLAPELLPSLSMKIVGSKAFLASTRFELFGSILIDHCLLGSFESEKENIFIISLLHCFSIKGNTICREGQSKPNILELNVKTTSGSREPFQEVSLMSS